jgi:phosphoglycolate phosphatase
MSRQERRRRRAEAFIFDLDGTLVDSGRDLAVSANFVRARFGLPELPEPVVVSFVGDGVGKLVERALADLDGASAADRAAEGLAVFLDHHDRHCLDHTRLYPGVLETLRRFADFPLMVATNKPRRFALKVLAGLRVESAFRRVVCGDDVALKKPDPEALALCLAGLDVDQRDVAMVGDGPNDVLAARALGCTAVGCAFGLTARARLFAAGPDLVLESFAQLGDHFVSRRPPAREKGRP